MHSFYLADRRSWLICSDLFGQVNTVNADRARDVLDRLFAQALKAKAELVADLIVHNARNHDAARIGQRLQPRRYIDAVSENVITVEDNVAHIDADTEFDPQVSRHEDVAFGHAALDINRATDRINHAHELHEYTVACRLDDPAAMFSDLGVDEFLTMRLKLAERAFVIYPHQPAIACNIACENRCQPAVHSVFRHCVHPRKPAIAGS